MIQSAPLHGAQWRPSGWRTRAAYAAPVLRSSLSRRSVHATTSDLMQGECWRFAWNHDV